jgi:hypothetical protein
MASLQWRFISAEGTRRAGLLGRVVVDGVVSRTCTRLSMAIYIGDVLALRRRPAWCRDHRPAAASDLRRCLSDRATPAASSASAYRSQAAHWAACSSRVMLGDLAGLPLLMNAPCPHCEQISTRGSDAAVVAPMCPQLGQVIRVSMTVTTAAVGAAARASRLRQQLRQLGDVGGDAPPARRRLVAGKRRVACPRATKKC